MAATFFVDENDLALGKALAKLHRNVLNPVGPWMYAITEAGMRAIVLT